MAIDLNPKYSGELTYGSGIMYLILLGILDMRGIV